VNTITNTNLAIENPETWSCEPLDTIEQTAKSLYYVSRLLRNLELLP
jgi:hypothetical protein